METAKVCLINATAVGTETLKSLVLPGIGAFSIIDGKKITEEDIGSKYFIYTQIFYRMLIKNKILVSFWKMIVWDYPVPKLQLKFC